MKKTKAEGYKLVLAHVRGLVKGAYVPDVWLPATREHFPFEDKDLPGRCGFDGHPAEDHVWNHYVGKRVPPYYQKPGARSPFRYCHPEDPYQ